MRNIFLFVLLEAIVLAGLCAVLYQKNGPGCLRVVDDVRQLMASVIPGSIMPPATPEQAGSPGEAPAPGPAVAPPAGGSPGSAADLAPGTIPAQPNWTWTTIAGRTYTNVKVLSVDPSSVMIMYDGGGERVPLAYLPASLQKLFNYTPPAGTTTNAAPSAITNMVAGNLVRNTTNGLQPVNDAALAPVRYFAIYYSAQWCPPCHAFTPKLVQFYNSFKPGHPNFEVIFVSEDHDENQMHDYMEEMAMPWPAVRYDKLTGHGQTFKQSGIESFADKAIPDLVLVDSSGKVLSDSFQNGTYVGPETVVADIPSLVK